MVVHVAGIAWHLLRKRENLVLGMVTGRRRAEAGDDIASVRPLAAAALLALVAALGVLLATGFDPATRRLALPLTGASLTLGEVEDVGDGEVTHRVDAGDDDEDSEDD